MSMFYKNSQKKSNFVMPTIKIIEPKKTNVVPDDLGLDPGIALTMVKALQKYTNGGILVVLSINPNAYLLHKLWFEKKFSAILKPIFVKEKSIKNSVLAPFILFKKPYKFRKYKVQAMNLQYPLVHLQHLCSVNKCIKILECKNGALKLQNVKDKKVFFTNKIDKLVSENSKKFFESKFYQANKLKLITIYDDKHNPIKVQGILENGKIKPIIADIDAHGFGEKYTYEMNKSKFGKVFNITRKNKALRTDKVEFLQAIKKELKSYKDYNKQALFNREEEKALLDIPETLGSITVREYVALFSINLTCNKEVLQHASTSCYPCKYPYQISKNEFPNIEENKQYGVILPSGKVISFVGESILAFYSVMCKHGYNFRVHGSWKMRNIAKIDLAIVEKKLLKYKLINKPIFKEEFDEDNMQNTSGKTFKY